MAACFSGSGKEPGGLASPVEQPSSPPVASGPGSAAGFDPAVFRSPSPTDRPAAFWFWNDRLDVERLVADLEAMHARGLSQVVIHARRGLAGGPAGNGVGDAQVYLSTAWFDAVERVVERAAELDVVVWLYDDLDWPSGTAGGRVIEGGVVDGEVVRPDPELVARYLQVHARDLSGDAPSAEPGGVALPDLDGGELVTLQALPVSAGGPCSDAGGRPTGAVLDAEGAVDLTDLARNVEAGHHVAWQPPPGAWCLVALAQHRLTEFRADRAPERLQVDYLNPAATEKFIATTHEVYARRLGDHLGTTVVGFYDDEPGFYGDFPDGRGGPAAQGSVPWTPNFDAVLDDARQGLTDDLVGLWWDVGPTTTATRVTFRKQLQQRYAEAFAGPLARWAAERDTVLVSNLLVEEDLGSHQLIQGGSWFAAQRPYTLPGLDVIGRLDVSSIHPQLTASVSQLFGRDRTLAEAFGAFGWRLDMATMRRTAAWLATGGVDLVTLHAVATSSVGGRGRDAPPSLGRQNTMWPHLRRFSELVGRLSYPQRVGQPVTDVAVLYPTSSVLGSGTPDTNQGYQGAGPELGVVDESWRVLTTALLEAQIDVTFLDEPALAGAYPEAPLTVEDGALQLGSARWDVLVVPALTVLDLDALTALQSLVDTGGTVIFTGWLPDREASGRHQQLGVRLEALLDHPGATRVTGAAGVVPAVRAATNAGVVATPATAQLRVRHVRRGPHEAFLLANVSTAALATTVSIAAVGAPQRWNPETSQVTDLRVWHQDAGRTEAAVELTAGESMWLVIDTAASPGDHATAVTGGRLLRLSGDAARVLVTLDAPAPVEVDAIVDGVPVAGVAAPGTAEPPQRLDGPWRLTLPGRGVVERPLGSWVDLHPSFSGTGTYRTTVDVPASWLAGDRRVQLDLGEVRNIADVTVNDTPVGVLPWPPYTLDVTDALQPGANSIGVAVSNTPANARARHQPPPSGLLGPVTLRPQVEMDVVLTPDRASSGLR